MATLVQYENAQGSGALTRVNGVGVRALKVGTYTWTGDSSQASGGEDISAIWNDFAEVIAIVPSQVTGTVANIRHFTADLTNKKLLAIKTVSSGANAEDTGSLDTIVVRLVVIGY